MPSGPSVLGTYLPVHIAAAEAEPSASWAFFRVVSNNDDVEVIQRGGHAWSRVHMLWIA